jgi:hypothetical protein
MVTIVGLFFSNNGVLLKRDCRGQSNCRHGCQCLQDSVNCPTCFYGLQCEFSSNGFSLSLDGILRYHIQPIIVQISITLAALIILTGFISGLFSLITFNNKDLCKNGCGIYLMCSSIVSLLSWS